MPAPDRCVGTSRWFSQDWSPDGNVDHGFRAWACNTRMEFAQDDLDRTIDVGKALWPAMTKPVPGGMGLPASDKGTAQTDGNGKVDVYLLDSFATCRMRGTQCDDIPGDAGAASTIDLPYHCGKNGSPPKGCSAYMLLNRGSLHRPDYAATFAHEFFHVLQSAHNGLLERNWYEEASAAWSEWEFVANAPAGTLLSATDRRGARDDVFDLFRRYQTHRQSLLKFLTNLAWNRAYQYEAWGWPLFQAVERGKASIFNTWVLLEGADLREEVDEAVDAQLPFADGFRDFAVRNAQPVLIVEQSADDMPNDRWRSKPLLGEFPEDQHHPDVRFATLPRGVTQHTARIQALNAHYEPLAISDPAIRSITIDISALQGHEHADIDVIGLVTPSGDSTVETWRRFRASGPVLTLCRDNARENVRFIEIVISNHSKQRVVNDPDPAAEVKGDFKIEASDKCKVPDHYTGTFSGSNGIDSWSGTATFDRLVPDALGGGCPPTTEVVSYCYAVVSGSATWTASGVTKVVSLAPPDAAGGIELIISDTRHPERNGTYILGPTPSTEIWMVEGIGRRSAFTTVRAWINAIKYPKYAADWRMAGTEGGESGCGIDGCGVGATWTWDLVASFDP